MSVYHYLPPLHGRTPDWMTAEPKSINHERKQRYYSKLYQASPAWVNRNEVYRIHRQARRLRDIGSDVSVDHIVPLSHPYVCGLNVPWNLEIVNAAYNQFKSNTFWPGSYFGQLEMFDSKKTEQYELQLSAS